MINIRIIKPAAGTANKRVSVYDTARLRHIKYQSKMYGMIELTICHRLRRTSDVW